MSLYDLTDFEWRAIKPVLPNKRRGKPRVDDRRVVNGIFRVLRSGAPWHDVPQRYGPYATCYNRFRRWMKAGIWDSLMDVITSASDDGIMMIDGTPVRVDHSAATLRVDHPDRCLGISRGGLTTKIHAVTDGIGLPVKIAITSGQAYDADWLRAKLRTKRSWASIPPKSNRKG